MKIKKFVMGRLESNAYLVYNEEKEAVLFDVGGINVHEITSFLKDNSLNLKSVILTHGHFDHIEGLEYILNYKDDLNIYIGEEEKKFLYDIYFNLSYHFEDKLIFNKDYEVFTLNEGDEIFGFKVISTPGHTEGGKCFYNEENKILITGDTIFADSIGRTDFPSGNIDKLKLSVKKLFKLPDDVEIYPGHGISVKLEKAKLPIKRMLGL